MKKLISICIAVLMILTMIPTMSFAAGEISIISPAADVYTDLTKFEVACTGAQKIIFTLDGTIVGETDGETTLAVSKNLLTVGNHTLETVAIFEDGTAASAVKKFNVSALVERFVWSNAELASADGISYTAVKKTVTELADAVGATGKADDKAKIFYYTDNAARTSNQPYVYNWTRDANKSQFEIGGIKKMSVNLKLNDVRDKLRIYNAMDGMEKDGYVIDGGVWLDGSGKNAASDGWMHLEMYSNNYTDKFVCTVDGKVIYDNVIVYKPSKKTQMYITILQPQERTETTRAGVTIDNLCYSQEFIHSIKGISWADSSGNWSSDISAIPTDTAKIRVAVNEDLNPTTVTSETIALYDNGTKVKLTEVAYDAENKYVTVTLGEALSNESDIVMELSEAVELTKAAKAAGVAAQAHLRTEAPAFAPTDIVYKKNSSALLSTSQLKAGDVVSVDLTLNNQSAETKTMAAVVCIYQNKKLRAIGACEESLSASSSKAATVTLPPLSTLDSEGEISVKVMVCNSLSHPQAYVNYYELN